MAARERILDAAYDLFSRHGVRAVGVDSIVSESRVAKMSLYRNFASKDQLAIAFLDEREERWTNGWLRAEIERRADGPRERLLAVFDVLGEWFARDDFEGCSFINVMLERDDRESPVRRASVEHLANVRDLLRPLAAAAGVADPDGFARQWHILMKGSIVAAAEGDREAAARAREVGALLLTSALPASPSGRRPDMDGRLPGARR